MFCNPEVFGAPVKVWATLDPTGGGVAINNKDTSASGVVQLAVPGFSSGIVKRMTTPSANHEDQEMS